MQNFLAALVVANERQTVILRQNNKSLGLSPQGCSRGNLSWIFSRIERDGIKLSVYILNVFYTETVGKNKTSFNNSNFG